MGLGFGGMSDDEIRSANYDEVDRQISDLKQQLIQRDEEIKRLREQKDDVYTERNKCVVGLMLLARDLGHKVGLARHPQEDTEWEDDWRNIAVINLPIGQLTWHFHDSEMAMLYSFELLPDHKWDGHSTAEKYRRLLDYQALSAPSPVEQVQRADATNEEAMEAYKASVAKNRRLYELLAEDERKELDGKVVVDKVDLQRILDRLPSETLLHHSTCPLNICNCGIGAININLSIGRAKLKVLVEGGKMNHTPPPWVWNGGQAIWGFDPNDMQKQTFVCHMTPPKVLDYLSEKVAASPAERSANARLICLAPVMLKKLKELQKYFQDPSDIQWFDCDMAEWVGDVIQKVEGSVNEIRL